MSRDNKTEYPVSAGGVVYRLDPDLQILLCGRNVERNDSAEHVMQWHLPKGTPESGETVEETALREVCEETGYTVRSEQYLQSIKYSFKNAKQDITYKKTVHFYLMSVISGDVSFHDHEFDEVKWVEPRDALSLIGYDNEKQIVRDAMDRLVELDDTRINHG